MKNLIFLNRMFLLLAVASLTATAFTSCNKDEPKPNEIAVTSINLNKTTLALTVGSSETLTATVLPDNATDKTVTWTSSNTAVATVDANGKVTAVAEGTATITAKAGDKTATCAVTVSGSVVAVTSINLNKTTLTLTVGGSETLTATVLPDNATDKTVTWTSSNTAVATVDANGKVTAVAVGTATITAKAGDKTATCAVTVSGSVVNVTDITLDRTALTLTPGSSATLTATVTPSNATNKTVTWTSSNTAAATVDANGKVTAVTVGTATITATAGDKTATCAVTSRTLPAGGVLINGVIWADRNVGDTCVFVAAPESYGKYYKWGRKIAWLPPVTYEEWNMSIPINGTWTTNADPSPAGWRVPTLEEVKSILDYNYVSRVWTTVNGVNGVTFTDIVGGNSIFLPAAGNMSGNNGAFTGTGSYGYYWSGTGLSNDDTRAYLLQVGIGDINGPFVTTANSMKTAGMSIRSVAE